MAILIVDDEFGIRTLLEEVLSAVENDIITAATGKEALDIVTNRSIQLMILDYNLPIINGFEVVERLHKRGNSVPTIMMSGLIENASNGVKNLPHVIELIEKPFDVQYMLEMVQSVLTESK